MTMLKTSLAAALRLALAVAAVIVASSFEIEEGVFTEPEVRITLPSTPLVL